MRNDKACEERWGCLNDLADGRLVGRKRSRLEAHIESCERCREALEEIRNIKSKVRQTEAPHAPDGLWGRCMGRIADRPARQAPFRWRRKPAVGVAAACLAAAAALVLSIGPFSVHDEDEIPHDHYVMEHAGFAAAQPLDMSSHHILLSAQGAENDRRNPDAESLETPNDAPNTHVR